MRSIRTAIAWQRARVRHRARLPVWLAVTPVRPVLPVRAVLPVRPAALLLAMLLRAARAGHRPRRTAARPLVGHGSGVTAGATMIAPVDGLMNRSSFCVRKPS